MASSFLLYLTYIQFLWKVFQHLHFLKAEWWQKYFAKQGVSHSDDTWWQLLWRFLAVKAFSSCQELFLSLFLHFCLCKLLLLKLLRVFHLFNLKLSHNYFQNWVPCWTKQRKQVSHDVILFICTLIDHGQRPITAHVALISLHRVL